MLIKKSNTTFFFYILAFILLFLPVVSINHNLIHTLNHNTPKPHLTSQQKIQYFSVAKHQHYQHHFCLLCSVWQQNKFSFFFTAFFTLSIVIFLHKIKNNRNFLFTLFIYSFLKTGPPVK
jgi:hypothetical protein